jgi:hypothetical protein
MMVRRFNLRSADEGEHMTRAVPSSTYGEGLFIPLPSGLDEVAPINRLAAGEAGVI